MAEEQDETFDIRVKVRRVNGAPGITPTELANHLMTLVDDAEFTASVDGPGGNFTGTRFVVMPQAVGHVEPEFAFERDGGVRSPDERDARRRRAVEWFAQAVASAVDEDTARSYEPDIEHLGDALVEFGEHWFHEAMQDGTLVLLEDFMRGNTASVVIVCGEAGDWSFMSNVGEEAPDSPMAGASFIGVGENLTEVIENALESERRRRSL